jgi:hypothetical protein
VDRGANDGDPRRDARPRIRFPHAERGCGRGHWRRHGPECQTHWYASFFFSFLMLEFLF